jgi:hypothetical protein
VSRDFGNSHGDGVAAIGKDVDNLRKSQAEFSSMRRRQSLSLPNMFSILWRWR